MPVRDDYLMRQLERLAQMVAAVLLRVRSAPTQQGGLEEIHRAYRDLFQIDPRFAHLVDPATLGERAGLFLQLREAERSLAHRSGSSTP